MPALRLRLRTTCVTCGNPIPLTSAHLPVACPTCDAVSTMNFAAFYWVAEERVTTRSEPEGATLLGVGEPADVTCAVCGAAASDEAIEQALAPGEVRCGCGNVMQVRAVPAGIDSAGWWSALVGETSRAKPAPSDAPVQFKCTDCGGALLVDGTTRTPTCSFCNTRVYVPDDLWRAVRPTPKAEPFYLWVSSAKIDRWKAQVRLADEQTHQAEVKVRRASLVAWTVAGIGTAIAAVGGIATCASGYGGEDNAGVSVFFMIFMGSFVIAGLVNWLLTPKNRWWTSW
jgi:DNA-directed RNA polymerase subunit RPC12/RpoP